MRNYSIKVEGKYNFKRMKYYESFLKKSIPINILKSKKNKSQI